MHLPAVLLLFLKVAQMNFSASAKGSLVPGVTPGPLSEAPHPILAVARNGSPRSLCAPPLAACLRVARRSLPRPDAAPARPQGALPSGRDRPALPRRPRRPPRRRMATAWSPVAPRDALSGALGPLRARRAGLPSVAPLVGTFCLLKGIVIPLNVVLTIVFTICYT